VLYP